MGGATINEALWARKSYREYKNEPLSLEEISGVMWAAAGINREYRALATLQDFANTASVNIVYIADIATYDCQPEMLSEKIIQLCSMDAAGYAENVNLYTAAYGLKSITRGGAKADEILKLLQLSPLRYQFILAQTVGK